MRTRIAPRRGGRVLITLLTGLLVGGVIGAGVVYLFGGKRAGKGNVVEPALAKADELSLVPADASAFIHVRISEGWKTDALAGLRGLVKSAGSDAVNSIDESFVPSPSSLERATIVLLRPEPPGGPPKKATPVDEPPKKPGKGMPAPPKVNEPPKGEPLESVTILTFSSAVDEAAVTRVLPEAAKMSANGKDYWVSPRKDGRWDQRDGKMMMVEEYRSERAVYFANNKTLVVGTGKAIDLFLTRPGVSQGPLTGALKQAGEGNRHVVMAANLQDEFMLKDLRDNFLPAEVGPFSSPVFHAQAISVSMIIGDPAKVEFRAFYSDEKSADEALTALREAAQTGWSGKDKPKMLTNGLKGRGGKVGPHFVEDAVDVVPTLSAVATLNMIQKMIQESEVKVDGKELTASIVYPTAGDAVVQVLLMGSGMTLPASQTRARQEREAALPPPPKMPPGGVKQPGPGGIAPMPMGPKTKGPTAKADPPKTGDPITTVQDDAKRFQSQNNLKQIGLVMHVFDSENGSFPAAAIVDKDKKPLLSWRVALLPYLDENELYKEFKLDEPWDSEHNKKLIAKMPKVFANPRVPPVGGKTYYKVFVSPVDSLSSAFTTDYKGMHIISFTDGTANTVLVVEGGEAVEWTKPDDIKFDPKGKAPELSIGGKEDICIVMADGAPRVVKWNAIDADVRKALITRQGGEVLPKDWDK